jgi:hypothetical protein
MFLEAGFTDIHVIEKEWPTNHWAKDRTLRVLGAWTELAFARELEALSMGPLTHSLGWDPAEVEVLCASVRKEFRNRRVHAYFPVVTAYGKKP